MYALLTGKPPYEAAGAADMIQKIQTAEPKSPTEFQMGLDERFSDLVSRMIKKSPDERFPTARALLEQLDRIGTLAGINTGIV